MKTYISEIIPKIQRFSQKLDNLSMLTNQHWVVIDDIENTKNVYIFRPNNELLISRNGKVEKAKWEYLGNSSLLIDGKEESYLFKHGFFDENILALKIDSKNEYAFLVNETRFDKELNSIENIVEFLNSKYIKPYIKNRIENSIGVLSIPIEQIESFDFNWEVIEEKHYLTTSFWGKNIDVYEISFKEVITGKIYKDSHGFYLYDETGSNRMYYIDKNHTINSLFTLLKTNKTSKDGFVKFRP